MDSKINRLQVYYVLVEKETGDFENDILFVDRKDAVNFKRDFSMPEAEVLPVHGWAIQRLSKGWQVME